MTSVCCCSLLRCVQYFHTFLHYSVFGPCRGWKKGFEVNIWSVGGKSPIALWNNPPWMSEDFGFTVDPKQTHIRFSDFISGNKCSLLCDCGFSWCIMSIMESPVTAVRISCINMSIYMEKMHVVVWFELCFNSPASCKKRKWLLVRNPDGSVINGTMNSMSLSLLSGKTSHKKAVSVSLFCAQTVRIRRKDNLYETLKGFESGSEKSFTVAEL